MIQSSTLAFLRELDANNHKEWFDAHRKEYDTARKDVVALVAAWINGVADFNTDVADNDASKALFRINRDVRFSKNKAPYKNNLGAAIGKGGKNGRHAGLYLHVQPDGCFFAGGKWMPEAEDLKKIRQEIDYNYEEFKSIIEEPDFLKYFNALSTENTLKTAPKGYEADHPAIEYLKLKSYVVYCPISEKEIQAEGFVKQLIQMSAALQPLISFLNRALDD